jgi:exoribonuclease-2
MIAIGSLVLYKNKPALLADRDTDRITLRLVDGETQKVREKDIALLHEGPLERFPALSQEGDFDTAFSMVSQEKESTKMRWKDLAELVYGTSSPSDVLACLRHMAVDPRFRISDGLPEILSTIEYDRMAEKTGKKASEEARRSAFVEMLNDAIKHKDDHLLADSLQNDSDNSRFVSEMEAFAYGSSQHCSIAKIAGIKETPEAVHAALIASGLWDIYVDPWPRRAGCPLSAPKGNFPNEEYPALSLERRDLTSMHAWAIDNEDSTDPDDAISFDGKRIWIHVADPSAYIQPDSSIDKDALERGATLYLPEKIVPMLPESAVGFLGLGLAEKSPAMSFAVSLESDGSVESIEVLPTFVRVTRLSYLRADESLLGRDPDFDALDSAARLRFKKRIGNGAVEIDFPEVAIRVFDGEIQFETRPRTRSAGIVKEMMLLAGEAAARWAYEKKLPFIYSSQQGGGGDTKADNASVPEPSLTPSENYSRRRGMRASILGPECQAHHGLGLAFYSQVTSPMRRYQDLLAHRQIRSYLRYSSKENKVGDCRFLDADEISLACATIGRAVAANRQAERDSKSHWIAAWLSLNREWQGQAVVLAHTYTGVVVFVSDFGIESEIACRSKPDLDAIIPIRIARVSVALHDFTFERASID